MKRNRTFIHFAVLSGLNLRKLLFSVDSCVIQSRGLEFVLRPRTLDIAVVAEIQLDRLYASRFEAPPAIADLVVDLGANFGAFAVWAHSLLKPKRLVLVEPCECNVRLLRMNARHSRFEDIAEIVPAAIYKRTGAIGFDRRRRAPGHSCILEGSPHMVNALTLRELVDQRQLNIIDCLKMDIEGAERFVLVDENRDIFAERVRYTVMELHGRHIRIEAALRYFERLGFERRVWDPEQWGCDTLMLEARNPRWHH